MTLATVPPLARRHYRRPRRPLTASARARIAATGLLLAAWAGPGAASTAAIAYVEQTLTVRGVEFAVRVPSGYVLEFLTDAMVRPRRPIFGPNGDLFVGSQAGHVYRLTAPYREPRLLINVGGYPHSVAFRDGEILVALSDGLHAAPYAPGQRTIARDTLVLLAPLPSGGTHDSRTVRVGPDGRVYVGSGISANCVNEYLDPARPFQARRGGVSRLAEAASGNHWEVHASGLRNPVGFDWHPLTGVMYATNNGPDHHGFTEPREYFSRLTPGSFHGMPWYQLISGRIQRDTCEPSEPPRALADVMRPVATFPARNAPLGMRFVPADGPDPRFSGDAVVALHGSWGMPAGGDRAGRRPPKLALVRFDAAGAPVRVDDLVTGFQIADGRRWARPAGIEVGADGSIYFTSDAALEGLFRLRRAAP